MKIIRTNSEDPGFIKLVALLDAELREKDGAENSFYAQFNQITMLNYAVVALENDRAIGCGAFKKFDDACVEIKRMYVVTENRNKGVAQKVLYELEKWAKESGYSCCILETGKRQPEAIQLYLKMGYQMIENYGQYKGVANSVCFKKII